MVMYNMSQFWSVQCRPVEIVIRLAGHGSIISKDYYFFFFLSWGLIAINCYAVFFLKMFSMIVIN